MGEPSKLKIVFREQINSDQRLKDQQVTKGSKARDEEQLKVEGGLRVDASCIEKDVHIDVGLIIRA